MDDNAIIELYWKRDEAAISETDKKYGDYCAAVAGNILSDRGDCEECVNDTWLKAWESMPPKRPDRLRLFLAKITRNLSFDRYKRNTAEKRGGGEISAVLGELDECIEGKFDTAGEAEAKELAEIIKRFIRTLKARERDVFLRRYFYAEPVRTISTRYSIKENNVLKILSRTRKKLREHLEKEGYGI